MSPAAPGTHQGVLPRRPHSFFRAGAKAPAVPTGLGVRALRTEAGDCPLSLSALHSPAVSPPSPAWLPAAWEAEEGWKTGPGPL